MMTRLIDFLHKYCKWIYAGCLIIHIIHILLCVSLIDTAPDEEVVPMLAFVAVLPVVMTMLYFQAVPAAVGFLCIRHRKATGFLFAANIRVLLASLTQVNNNKNRYKTETL